MCMFDDSESLEFYAERRPVAAKPHECGECGRTIAPGERYFVGSGKQDGYFYSGKICRQCERAVDLLKRECGGFLFSGVREDLEEHLHEALPWRLQAARLVVGIRRRWQRFDGRGLMAPLTVLLLITLTGCTALTTATDAADTAVRLYCSRTPEARALLREHIATKLKPNRVEIQCAEQ